MTVAVIYGGTRQNGNTEILTEQAIQGLEVERIYLRDYVIQPIEDLRHTKEGFHDVDDHYNQIIEQILLHDTIVFSTPIYWYGMSGTMKNFIDRWSQTLRDLKYPDFKSNMSTKEAYVIAVGGDEPHIKGLPLIQQYHYIFNFIGISYGGYILGKGNKPGEVIQDKLAVYQAQLWNKKFHQMGD